MSWLFSVDNPKKPDFSHPETYDIEGVVNFHIETKDLDGSTPVRIGAWLIIPQEEMVPASRPSHEISTACQLLVASQKPVLLYLHGVACNRALPIKMYKVLRQFFIIVAVDHRGEIKLKSSTERLSMYVDILFFCNELDVSPLLFGLIWCTM